MESVERRPNVELRRRQLQWQPRPMITSQGKRQVRWIFAAIFVDSNKPPTPNKDHTTNHIQTRTQKTHCHNIQYNCSLQNWIWHLDHTVSVLGHSSCITKDTLLTRKPTTKTTNSLQYQLTIDENN